MTEDLPRRPFHQLPTPPDGLGSVVTGGRRLRRRRQALTASGLAGAVVVAVAVAVAGGGATPTTTDRLITRQTPSPTASPSAGGRSAMPTRPGPGAVGVPTVTSAPSRPGTSPAATATTAAPRVTNDGYRTPALRRSYQPADPFGARICSPDSTNASTRAGWCLDASATRTDAGHDLTLTLCRDRTGSSSLTFRGEQEADLVVRRGSTVVWRWSAGQDLDGPAHSLAVDVGACWIWSAPWTDVDGAGHELPSGSYSLTAISTARELASLPEDTVPFTI